MPTRTAALAFVALLGAACARDVTPEDTGASDSASGAAPLAIECGDVGVGAVGAWYEHWLSASVGEGAPWFVADGLPPGLRLSYGTGRVAGWPDEAGTYDVRMRIGDRTGARAEVTCPIEIRPALAVDLTPLRDRPAWCLGPDEPLTDLLVPGTGDDSALTCAFAGRSPDGKLPAGVEVDAEACTVGGSVTETTLGTWAFVVTATQANGGAVYVPYCATQATDPGPYTITVKHSGLADAALVPWSEAFPREAPLSAAVGGPGAVPFAVTDAARCTTDCQVSAWWRVDHSPVDTDALALTDLAVVEDNRHTVVGVEHGFALDRAWIEEDLYERPVVVQTTYQYCVATQPGSCDTVEEALEIGEGFEFAMILLPE